jgi:uncharacterized protein involved in outer membrane biogenesis
LKRFFLFLILAVLAATLALLGAYAYLRAQDSEQLRSLLEASLESALGRDVALIGPLNATLSPLPAIQIGDVSIGNAAWATRPTMLTIENVELRPRLTRLLFGDITLNEVRIRGARLYLENGPDGRGNWQFRTRETEQELEIQIRSLIIEDLEATYSNPAATADRQVVLDRLRLGARPKDDLIQIDIQGHILEQAVNVSGRLGVFKDLMEGRPFPIALDASIGDTSLTISGRIDDPDFRDYQGIRIDIDAKGRRPVVLMGWTDLAIPPLDSFEISGTLVGGDGRLAMNGLRCRFNSAGYRLSLDGAIGHLPRLEGLDLQFDAAGDRIIQMLPWSDQESTLNGDFTARGHLRGTMTDPHLDPVNFSAELDEARLEIEGTVSDIPDGGRLDARITIDANELAAVGEDLHLSLPDLDRLQLTGALSGTLTQPVIKDLQARIVEGSLTADVSGSVDALVPASGVALKIDLTGSNFADLSDILGVKDLPETDSAAGSGLLRGGADNLNLVTDRLRLARRDGTELNVSGTIDSIGQASKLDLIMRLSGVNLRMLETFDGVLLPQTDSYSINGRLVGSVFAPDLENVDARARLGKTAVTLKGRFPNVLDFERLDARVEAAGDDLAILGRELEQTWPDTRTFQFTGHAFGETQSPRIDELAGRLITDEIDLSFSGAVDDVLGGQGFDLQVVAEAPSLTPFLPFGGYLWDALGQARARFSLAGSTEVFDVGLTELAAGTSSLRGQFTYTKPTAENLQRIEGAFQQSTLDLTPWLELEKGPNSARPSRQSAGPASPQTVFSDTPLPLGWLQDLFLDVDLAAIEILFGKSLIEIISGNLAVSDQVMSIDPAQLKYRDARIDGRLSIAGGETPGLSLKSQTQGLDVGDLARRAGLSDEIRGLIDVRLDIDAVGGSPREMAAGADGHLTLLMTEGFAGGTDLPLHFSQMLTYLMPWLREDTGINIECVMLDLPISNGTAALEFFVLDTPDMLMRGGGKIDFGTEKYDLLLVPRAKRARALAHKVDVRVGGTLREPKIRYDAAAAGLGILEAAGRLAILGPAGLFVSSDSFRKQRQECAQSLDRVRELK